MNLKFLKKFVLYFNKIVKDLQIDVTYIFFNMDFLFMKIQFLYHKRKYMTK